MKLRLKYRIERPSPQMFATGYGNRSPRVSSLFSSLLIHAAIVGVLMLLPAAAPPVFAPRSEMRWQLPTEIRIGKQLYFVTQLPEYTHATPAKPTHRDDGRARSKSPAEERAKAPTLRQVLPPQLYTTQTGRTLIQPIYAPELIPAAAELPSFEIHYGLPRYRRRFIVPGRGPVATESAGHATAPADLVIAPMDAPRHPDAKVFLPEALSADLELPGYRGGVPPEEAGDPIEIVSVNPGRAAWPEHLTIPPGNVIGSGDGGSSRERPGELAVLGSEAGQGDRAPLAWGQTPGGIATRGMPHTIDRLPTGDFDAVIVQSSALPFAEGKLLRGRPVYTVYIAAGTPKDWILYFCVPGDTPAPEPASVIHLASNPVIRAPWPMHLVIPDIAPIPGEKQILVYGSVELSGNFERLRILRPEFAESNQALIQSLAAWRFRAATKDGVPISVEAILSIPLAGLPPAQN